MITVEKATIKIDESDLRRMLDIVDTYKADHPDVCNDPMPDGDMDMDSFRRLQRKRGYLRIIKGSGRLCFEIVRSEITRNQESERLYLDMGDSK